MPVVGASVPSRVDLAPEDVAALDEMGGEPAFRARQVWAGLHRGLDPEEMTDLPLALRRRLADALRPALRLASESVGDGGDTVKWLWSLRDGARVETVLMRYPGRATVCVSTQAGCAMACAFCATGQAGFTRHLATGEIVEQVVRARRAALPDRLSNVVLMGMGEPLANYEATWNAVRRAHDHLGLSARHLTVSTVGLVPGIRRLASEALPVNLAVSLHAANDELRDRLVPVNRRWPLAVLVEACRDYLAARSRRLSLEWAMIGGVNDRARDAEELAAVAVDLRAHVNLIPLNPTPGYAVQGSPPAVVQAFAASLRRAGVNTTVRRNRGVDIDGACGQLAARADPARATEP